MGSNPSQVELVSFLILVDQSTPHGLESSILDSNQPMNIAYKHQSISYKWVVKTGNHHHKVVNIEIIIQTLKVLNSLPIFFQTEL